MCFKPGNMNYSMVAQISQYGSEMSPGLIEFQKSIEQGTLRSSFLFLALSHCIYVSM